MKLLKILYYAIIAAFCLTVGCKQERQKSLSEITSESRRIIESKMKETGESVKIRDYNIGRVTQYKYEGAMTLDNGDNYDVTVYNDPSDEEDNMLVRWSKQNVFNSFLK